MVRLQPILDEKDKKRIFQSAVTMLENAGFLCNHAETLAYFREAGCKIGKELDRPRGARQVLFTESIVAETLKKAPAKFTLYPTSPGYREMSLNGKDVYVIPEGGDQIWDFRSKAVRRTGIEDAIVMSRVADACEYIDGAGQMVLWLHDLAPEHHPERFGTKDVIYPLNCLHSGKTKFEAFETATTTEVPTMLRTWQLCAGGEEAFREKPCGALIVSMTSPYFLGGRIDPNDPWDHADSLVLMAKAGGVIGIEPSGLLGATGPVTVPGLVVQSVAEFLGMNVAVQTLNPGNPVIFKDLTGSCDMYSGGISKYVHPEANLVHTALTEMARYLKVPRWTEPTSATSEVDCQMAWEYMANLLVQYLAGTDIISSAGSIQLRYTDPRALIMADEMSSWIRHFAQGFKVDEESIPLDLMTESGHAPLGGNFLGADHTLRFYRQILWQPSKLTNSLSRDAWVEAGGKSLLERSAEMVEDILATHEPKVPEHQQKELRGLIADILDREGIKGSEAREIMERTYWQGIDRR